MNQDLLKIEHLAASVEDKEILKDVSLKIGRATSSWGPTEPASPRWQAF